MNKVQKQLNFTCAHCAAVFSLFEIHQEGSKLCREECQKQWQALLSKHYQDHIILNLAHQESQKEVQND